MKTENTSQAPVIYIKLRSYLKEYLMNLEDSQGNKIYGHEPIRFGSKTRLRLLMDRYRRIPGPRNIPFVPVTREEKENSIAVELNIDESVRGDNLRTFLSPYAQGKIAKYIYDEFLTVAAEYINMDLNLQRQIFPNSTPNLTSAYRSFFDAYGIESMDEETIRKAFNRRKEQFSFELVKKKFERKINILPFSADILSISAEGGGRLGQNLLK